MLLCSGLGTAQDGAKGPTYAASAFSQQELIDSSRRTAQLRDLILGTLKPYTLSLLLMLVIKVNIHSFVLQVLKESFHPQVAPRVRMWLNEAGEEGW